jgi:hypothetical protein
MTVESAETENPRAVMGGNNPPPAPPFKPESLEKAKATAATLLKRADEMTARGPIKDADHAQEVADVVAALREGFKVVDGIRKDEKKPHDDNAQAVQDAFTVFTAALTKAAEKQKAISAAWLIEEDARLKREQEERAAAARKAAADAFAAAQLAESRGDSLALAEAEKAKEDAAKEQKKAEKPAARAKVDSATGAGRGMSLRETAYAKIESQNAVYMHFREHPEVAELLQRLANQAVRSKDWVEGSIKGVTRHTTTSAA